MMSNAYIPAADGGLDFFFVFSILEYDYLPIVFVAKDNHGSLYLCDCVECRWNQQWTIAKTSLKTVREVIEGQLSVYDALKADGNKAIVVTFESASKTYTQKAVRFDELTDEDLPDRDSFICYPEPDAMEEFGKLAGEFIKTTSYTIPRSSRKMEWGQNSLNGKISESDSNVSFVLSISDLESRKNGGDGLLTRCVFRFIDMVTENRALSGSFHSRSSDHNPDRPDSPIAA